MLIEGNDRSMCAKARGTLCYGMGLPEAFSSLVSPKQALRNPGFLGPSSSGGSVLS
jgi:hypothetical protein